MSLFNYIVQDECKSGQYPGYRIAENDGGKRRSHVHYNGEPDDAHNAHPHQGDDHRDDHISHSAKRPGKHFDEYIYHIPWGDKEKHVAADPYHFGVRGKQPEQECPGNDKEDHEGRGYDQVHQKADARAFAHPVHFSGPVILPYKSSDGDAECSADHPEDRVQFAKG